MAAMNRARTFLHDRSGNFGPAFVLLSTIVITASAFGIEAGRLGSDRVRLQAVTDSAALYGVKLLEDKSLGDGEVRSRILAFIATQFKGEGFDEENSTVDIDRDAGKIQISAAATHVPILPFLSMDSVDLGVVSEAGLSAAGEQTGPGICGLALSPQESQAMQMRGEGSIKSEDCIFWSNSRDGKSTLGMGGGDTTAARVCSVGKYSSSLGYNVAPPPEDYCAPIADPLASWSPPAVDWKFCDFGGADAYETGGTNADVILDPGVYCGGLTIKNAGSIVFKPGRYFISGKVDINAKSSISGEHVYFHVGPQAADIDIKAASVGLSATHDKDLRNVVFYKAAGDDPIVVSIQAIEDFRVDGIIYAPDDTIELKAISAPTTEPSRIGVIARMIDWVITDDSVNLALKPGLFLSDDGKQVFAEDKVRLLK